MAHTHSISICFFIGVGSRYETETEAGISHFIEHLCFKGTQKRPTSYAICTDIEGVGGVINAGTDKELTLYWCKVAQPHFIPALEVLADMLLHSRFDPADLERERQVIIEEINMTTDVPSQQVGLLIDRLLWPDHPLGRDTAGTKESMAGITRETILEYIQKQYQPDNVVAAIAGNITHEEAVAAVSHAMDGWTSRFSRTGYLTYGERPNPRLLVENRNTEQAHLCLALPGLSLRHPQRFTLDLLNVILGEGMSSRLFNEIRDKLGLAYSIHSAVDHFLDTGSITIYAGVEPKNLQVAVKAVLEQLSLLKEPVPESELTKAKELAKGRLLLRMEGTREVAGWLGGQEILSGRILSVDEVVKIIDAITADELRQLAKELLIGEQLRLAVVGPVADSAPLLEILKI